jgi:hypothetical protein
MKRLALLVTLFAAACGGVGPKSTASPRIADHRLVQINPDVKTIIDADQPVFFARGSYWLFEDGRWFRADRVDASAQWTYVAKPPVPVLQIDQPYAFVHYKKDRTGKEIEVVASGYQGQDTQDAVDAAQPTEVKSRPAKERQPAAVDPSVDPTVNLAPAF